MLQIQWPTCIEIADRLGSDYAIIILSPQEVGSIFDVNKHSEGIYFRLVHEPDAESKRLVFEKALAELKQVQEAA